MVVEARWPWRGTHWCHLVSDDNLGELHAFAARLGCRRIGFQGDHYDIDVDTRAFAVELGAETCSSRELVRRLRNAGLRLRPSSFTKWSLVGSWQTDVTPESLLRDLGSLPDVATESLRRMNGERLDGAFRVSRPRAQALVLLGAGLHPPEREDPSRGVYVRQNRQGGWSLEVVDPPLADHE